MTGSKKSVNRTERSSSFFDDEETRAAIREVKETYAYTIDPHGAVGWLAAKAWRAANPDATTITLETAHPAKFLDVMDEELGKGSVKIPQRLAVLADKEKVATPISTDKATFHHWLRDGLS